MRHQWNTGRPYSEHGQRIVAEVVNEGIIFNDIDRHVSGLIPCYVPPMVDSSRANFKEFVMFNYDFGAYKHDELGRDRTLTWEV